MGKTSLPVTGWTYDDFYHLRSQNKYLVAHDNSLWPAVSVNRELPMHNTGQKNAKGEWVYITATQWLQENRPVHQLVWSPGDEKVIEGRQLDNGGWIETDGYRAYNVYQPPIAAAGDASDVAPWLDHVHTVYPDDANHIISWLAHRVQKPHEKINHALVLGGYQGIGKDTIIEPALRAVGPQNCHEVTPAVLVGRFNNYVRSVILRISEAHDLGRIDRYDFYEHCKPLIAAPPFALRCDEKNLAETYVPNVMGVIITTNHKVDGLYLPEDDRRHYVCWSECRRDDFVQEDDAAGQPVNYFAAIYTWFNAGGYANVGTYLSTFDLSSFDPTTPPCKTPAFWAIVDSNRPAEDAELADLLERMASNGQDRPEVMTKRQLIDECFTCGDFPDLLAFLQDRRARKKLKGRMEANGYTVVPNDSTKDKLWKIQDKRQQVYALSSLSPSDRLKAVMDMIANLP